jgi:hypothetical protein
MRFGRAGLARFISTPGEQLTQSRNSSRLEINLDASIVYLCGRTRHRFDWQLDARKNNFIATEVLHVYGHLLEPSIKDGANKLEEMTRKFGPATDKKHEADLAAKKTAANLNAIHYVEPGARKAQFS